MQSLQINVEEITMFILQMRKSKVYEVKQFAQD